MRIGIAAGHSARTEGEQLWEWRRCRAVQLRLSEMLRWAGHLVIVPQRSVYDLDNDASLAARIELFNQRQVDIAIDLHLNAGHGDYSTCLYWDDPSGAFSERGKMLAVEVAAQFRTTFPWRGLGARGQSSFDRRLAFLTHTQMPAVITECGFKDEPAHRAYLETWQGTVLYATSVFQGICRYIDTLKVAAV